MSSAVSLHLYSIRAKSLRHPFDKSCHDARLQNDDALNLHPLRFVPRRDFRTFLQYPKNDDVQVKVKFPLEQAAKA
jgi:hypothetical protein